jgi:branched-chain amino acid transport system substrate-binding protein
MKNRTVYWLGIWTMIIIISFSVMSGCTASPTVSSTTPAPLSSMTQVSTPVPVAAGNSVKIGLVFNLSSDVGLDGLHAIQLLADADNQNGGLSIGGQKYKVELISYDSQGSQATEVAAINRLIFEDNAKYILAQGSFQGAWLSITESNKIIVMTADQNSAIDLAPTTHYTFNPTFQDPEVSAKVGWFCKNYQEQIKNMVGAFIDNQFGHLVSMLSTAQFMAFGANPTSIFFPANQQDLSSVGTKIANMNPGVVMCMSGSSNTDGLAFAAVYQAGYRGQFFSPTNNPTSTWLQVASPEVLEGFITGLYCTEPDPALTKTSQNFKDMWAAKYGNWQDPNIMFSAEYACLKAALEKAGDMDTDKVSEAIASGLEYSAPNGDGKMISRPDLGNNRTVDSVTTYYLKKIHNGKTEILATIGMDEAINYMNTAAAAMPSGPPGGGPPGSVPPAGVPPTVP